MGQRWTTGCEAPEPFLFAFCDDGSIHFTDPLGEWHRVKDGPWIIKKPELKVVK